MSLPQNGPRNTAAANGVRSYEGPGVAFDWFEVEGPLVEQWPPASQRRLFGDGSKQLDRDDVRPMLRRFADRAFRRPVDLAEIGPYARVVESQMDQGESLHEAMLTGYRAILCSPDFLFIGLEDGVDNTDKPDTRFALASRLSYFLWNSTPDQTLRQLAASGELADPQTLRKQVDRMLADPRSERFVEHFLDQWLEMDMIDFTTPDPQLYPEFDAWLRDSMLAETRAYFRKMLTDNLGAGHLVDADFVLINQRLAELYGIRGVTGAKLRAVDLADGSPRGGLLTQASVLSLTSDGTRHRPVHRGVWVSEAVFGKTPPPPPPNVEPLAPTPAESPKATIREQLEAHATHATCASCHRKIDPLGFACDNFDAIALRGTYLEQNDLSFRDRLHLLAKICEGVHQAHLQGVVHRDLKPDNILIDHRGAPKVLDFGVARFSVDSGQESIHTMTGQILGTIAYMSPEQARGAGIDARSDQFSLATILYELLTQRLPFETRGYTVAQMMRTVAESDPYPIANLDPDLRGDAATIVHKALDPDPARR